MLSLTPSSKDLHNKGLESSRHSDFQFHHMTHLPQLEFTQSPTYLNFIFWLKLKRSHCGVLNAPAETLIKMVNNKSKNLALREAGSEAIQVKPFSIIINERLPVLSL